MKIRSFIIIGLLATVLYVFEMMNKKLEPFNVKEKERYYDRECLCNNLLLYNYYAFHEKTILKGFIVAKNNIINNNIIWIIAGIIGLIGAFFLKLKQKWIFRYLKIGVKEKGKKHNDYIKLNQHFKKNAPIELDKINNHHVEIWECILFWMNEKKLFTDPELTSQVLASKCFTNKTYINNIVKSHTGKTFNDFINEYRIEFTKNLLVEYVNYNTLYIANKAGFSSKSSFYRIFKEKVGISPGRYRQIYVRKYHEISK